MEEQTLIHKSVMVLRDCPFCIFRQMYTVNMCLWDPPTNVRQIPTRRAVGQRELRASAYHRGLSPYVLIGIKSRK